MLSKPQSVSKVAFLRGFTADDYYKIVENFQAKPTYGPGEIDFNDSTIETVCKGLDTAAAAMALGGLFFPPLEFLALGVGAVSTFVRVFDKSDKMQELLDKLIEKIDHVALAMDLGFADLEKVITQYDYLSEVVLPARELYAAYLRCVKNNTNSDREEFLELYERRNIGGFRLVQRMQQKLEVDFPANFFVKSLAAADYRQNQYIQNFNYVMKTLMELTIAHTYYLCLTNEGEQQKNEQGRFMDNVVLVQDRLISIDDLKETAYFNKDVMRKVIDQRIQTLTAAPYKSIEYCQQLVVDSIAALLSESYPWDRFLVVIWKMDYRDTTDIHLKKSENHTRHFENVKIELFNRYPLMNIVVHRIHENTKRAKIIDYASRKSVGDQIVNRLNKDRSKEFDVLKETNTTDADGFVFWSHWARNNLVLDGEDRPAYEAFACTEGAKGEFYEGKTDTNDTSLWEILISRRRINHFVFTY